MKTITTKHSLFAVLAGLVLLLVGLSTSMAAPPQKVEVCHLPPDDPANFHTITISEKALQAHLDHGDRFGTCGLFSELLCDDLDACTVDAFFEGTESCIFPLAARNPTDCDDGDPNTADSCDTVLGCINEPICTPPPAGLVSWLPGDGDANDIVGANDGTLVGSGTTFGTGLVDQAFSFNGAGAVQLQSPPAVSNIGSWTYDLWINVSSFTDGTIKSGDGSYFIDRSTGTTPLASLKAVGGQFAIQLRYDSGFFPSGPIGGTITTGTWTHIAMVREFNNMFHLYVDGILVSSLADTGNLSLTPPIPHLGNHANLSLGFVGFIDEFEIFNRALSQSEIQAIVDAGSNGKCK